MVGTCFWCFRRGRVFGRVVLLDGSRFWTGHVTRLLGWTVRFGMSGEFIQSHRSELQHRASLASSQRRRMRVSDGSSSKQTRSTRQRQPSFATLISGILYRQPPPIPRIYAYALYP